MESAIQPLEFPIACRAWVEKVQEQKSNPKATPKKWKCRKVFREIQLGDRIMVLDTETTTDKYQNILFGNCQIFEKNRLSEFIFHGNSISEAEKGILTGICREKGIYLLEKDRFVNEVCYPEVFSRGTTLVCFNAPFDLSRLAIAASPSRSQRWVGAFTLQLTKDLSWPRIRIMSLSSKEAFIQFCPGVPPAYANRRRGRGFPGYFVDVRQVIWALTGESHSLESGCKKFGVAPPKKQGIRHGRITADYVEYNRNDVRATYELYGAVAREFRKHPIELSIDKA